MIVTEQKRRRPKPHFSSELPIRVGRIAASDPRFDALIQSLDLIADFDLIPAREQLNNTAGDLKNSRRMQNQKPSRPDSSETLLALSKRMKSLSDCIANLSPHDAMFLDNRFGFDGFANPDPGVSSIEAMAEVLRSLEDTAYGALQANSYPEDEKTAAILTLSALHDQAKIAVMELEGLCNDTEWALVLMQQHITLFPETLVTSSPLSATKVLVDRMEKLTCIARRIATKQRGTKYDTAQSRAVCELRSFYEQATDKPATHSSVSGRQYSGKAESDYGKFVMRFMDIADPNPVNRRGLHEAIRDSVSPNRIAKRASSVKKAQKRLGKKIRQFVAESGL